MRIAIVDDEPLARARLRALLDELAVGEVVAEGGNGVEALDIVASHAPDVLLLDIRMPGMDGIEAARHIAKLPQAPAVIFTTAYDEHALAAFEASAVDYLLKPIRADRLGNGLKKAQALSAAKAAEIQTAGGKDGQRSHVSALLNGKLVVIPTETVLFFQSDQGYTRTVWDGGELLIEDSLKQLEDEFPQQFIRVHRNSLVAANKIRELDKDGAGNYCVSLAGSDEILAVSRRLVSQVRKRLRG